MASGVGRVVLHPLHQRAQATQDVRAGVGSGRVELRRAGRGRGGAGRAVAQLGLVGDDLLRAGAHGLHPALEPLPRRSVRLDGGDLGGGEVEGGLVGGEFGGEVVEPRGAALITGRNEVCLGHT
jgi:hypothetical protein